MLLDYTTHTEISYRFETLRVKSKTVEHLWHLGRSIAMACQSRPGMI
jgi:hypothetical protein